MQHCCSHLRTEEMLDDVEGNVNKIKLRSTIVMVQHHPTSCNMVAKRVQHVGFNNQCWTTDVSGPRLPTGTRKLRVDSGTMMV